MSKRYLNFSAGPAMLPESVLQQVHQAIFDWDAQGVSILEIGHRTERFYQLIKQCQLHLRQLLEIPETHEVLFVPSGTTAHFAYMPQNLLGTYQKIDYVDTGYWSQKAIAQAKKYTQINIVASGKNASYLAIPDESSWQLSEKAAFVHYVDNETVDGVEFSWVPHSPYAPLVADMTSSLLSKPIDIAKFGAIYAGAQKNLGIAGISVVIMNKQLLSRSTEQLPDVFNYQKIAQADSLYSTPAIFAWYVLSLMLEWAIAAGGVNALYQQNLLKAQRLYDYIDQSEFYDNPIDSRFRSRMNVVLTLNKSELEDDFLISAKKAGIIGLKGHRARGGIRVSLYNTISIADVDKLIDFMDTFVKTGS